jgi:hypothetical protein
MRIISRAVGVLALCAAMTASQTACNAASFVQQFNQYSNQIAPAVQTILSLIAIFAVPNDKPDLVARISSDVAAAQKLVADFAAAATSDQPAIHDKIKAVEAAIKADLQEVFALAHVSNPATQTKVSNLLDLVGAMVEEGFALIPVTVTPGTLKAAAPRAGALKAKDYVGKFNKLLAEKTGDDKVDSLTPSLKLKRK